MDPTDGNGENSGSSGVDESVGTPDDGSTGENGGEGTPEGTGSGKQDDGASTMMAGFGAAFVAASMALAF